MADHSIATRIPDRQVPELMYSRVSSTQVLHMSVQAFLLLGLLNNTPAL